MSTVTIPNRPFASERFTGLMLPDGIFVTTLGVQAINAHFANAGAATVAGATAYIEGTSHPGIVVTPATRSLGQLSGGATRAEAWDADFSACPPGTHHVSFVVERAGVRARLIKKIFVTRVTFDPATVTFSAETPEGVLTAQFSDFVRPKHACCCRKPGRPKGEEVRAIDDLAKLFAGRDAELEFCLPGYLPDRVRAAWLPTPPYPGQYSDLPFQDPWWKILLCIVVLLLLIAAAIAEAVDGSGDVTVGGGSGGGGTGGTPGNCCGVEAGGGGTSPIAAGLVAAAGVVATIAGCSDVRDVFRRGQDHTAPAAGELTVRESLDAQFNYPEPVALGRPCAVGLKWEYERHTSAGAVYTHGASDVTQNVHVLSKYEITAPDVARMYQGPWVVKARFLDADGRQFKGGELFVQCFLVGPKGERRKFVLQDDGNRPDDVAGDGTFTGQYYFRQDKSPGLWTYYVIAQDVNHAQPEMTPEEAAQIIGGLVVTHQLVITFDEDDCPFVPDGHVNVL